MKKSGVNRRDVLKTMAGAAAIAAAHIRCGTRSKANMPNFIVIMADDCSAKEFGCYGNTEIRTPNVDGLAAGGVQFRTCWSEPLCMPSRAQIMTGKFGYQTGWYHNSMTPLGTQGYSLGKAELTFGKFMRQNGYATAIAGKWQIGARWDDEGRDLVNEAYGFDQHCLWALPRVLREEHRHYAKVAGASGPYWEPGQRGPYWQPAVTINGELLPTKEDDFGPDIFTSFVNDFVTKHRHEPFFVYYPIPLIHDWWYPPVSEKIKKNIIVPVPELDANGNKTGKRTKEHDSIQGGVKDNVEYLDHLVGKIIHNLEEQGVRGNTVVLFTCDNGTWGYGKGHLRNERPLRVPMVVNCPGIVKAQGESDALVQLADVLPIMAELAGIDMPADAGMDGVSFAPVLTGEKKETREWIFAYHADQRALRDKRWFLDGEGRLFDCGDNRSAEGYADVTGSAAPEALEAKKKFNEILKKYPPPPPDDTNMKLYLQRQERLRDLQRRLEGGNR